MSIKYIFYWYRFVFLRGKYPSVLKLPIRSLWLLPEQDFYRWLQRINMYRNEPEQLKYHVPEWFLRRNWKIWTKSKW